MSLLAASTKTELIDHSVELAAVATKDPITVVPTPATNARVCVASFEGANADPRYWVASCSDIE